MPKLIIGLGCVLHLGLIGLPLWLFTDGSSGWYRGNIPLFFLLCFCHCLLESFVSEQAVATKIQVRSHVFLPYGLGICLLLCTWIAVFDASQRPVTGMIMTAIAASAFVTGILLRLFSILNLKRYFVSHLTLLQEHILMTTGIHGWLRHPSECGLLLIGIATALLLNSWLSLGCFAVSVLPLVIYRVRKEEQMLLKNFPEAYHQYRLRTPALIPRFSLK